MVAPTEPQKLSPAGFILKVAHTLHEVAYVYGVRSIAPEGLRVFYFVVATTEEYAVKLAHQIGYALIDAEKVPVGCGAWWHQATSVMFGEAEESTSITSVWHASRRVNGMREYAYVTTLRQKAEDLLPLVA